MSLVWLFREYRQLVDRAHSQELELARLVDRNLALESDNKRLSTALEMAHDTIQSNPSHMNAVMDLLQRYQEKVLEELPFTDGQEPQWLTPETDMSRG